MAGPAAAAPLAATLHLPQGARLDGRVLVGADAGALDLAPAVAGGEPLTLTFARAHGYVVTREREYVGVPGVAEQFRGMRPATNASLRLGAGALSGFACGERCSALLMTGEDARVALEGLAEGDLRFAHAPRVYASGGTDRPAPDSFLYRAEAGWLVAAARADGPHLALADAAARASGDLVLFLSNGSAAYVGADGARDLDARESSAPTRPADGVTVGRRVAHRFLVLHLEDAALATPEGTAATLLAPAPALRLDGRLDAPEAHGVLTMGGRRVEAAGERLEVEGALDAAPAWAPGPLAQLAPADGLRTTLDGDATRVRLDGQAVVPVAASPRTVAVVAGVTLGALAAAWCVKMAGLALYMRLTHAAVLRNGNRRRVYDAVRASPGLTTAQLVRLTGMPEMVVRHHLRMLEAHRYLTVRPSGKMRAYFVMDGSVDPASMAVHAALKDETRRRIATAIATSPTPRTQADLALATGVSRRLVSYHLAHLEEKGLLHASGTMPREYEATGQLREFLAARPALVQERA